MQTPGPCAFGAIRLLGLVGKTNSISQQFRIVWLVQNTANENAFYPRSPYGVAKCTRIGSLSFTGKPMACCGQRYTVNHESRYAGNICDRKITRGVAQDCLGLEGNIYGKLNPADWVMPRICEAMWLILQQLTEDFVIAWETRRFVFCKCFCGAGFDFFPCQGNKSGYVDPLRARM